MIFNMYTDGGARGNPGPAGIGIVICTPDNTLKFAYKKYIGKTTNNEAEYIALLAGLKLAQEKKITELRCFLDSELVVKQLNGTYKVKNDRLKKLYDEVITLAKNFSVLTFAHIARTENKQADKLVNEALDEHTNR